MCFFIDCFVCSENKSVRVCLLLHIFYKIADHQKISKINDETTTQILIMGASGRFCRLAAAVALRVEFFFWRKFRKFKIDQKSSEFQRLTVSRPSNIKWSWHCGEREKKVEKLKNLKICQNRWWNDHLTKTLLASESWKEKFPRAMNTSIRSIFNKLNVKNYLEPKRIHRSREF